MSKRRSAAQQAGLDKYIHAKQMFKDFSAAQGYAACYAERLQPMAHMLQELISALEVIKQEGDAGIIGPELVQRAKALLKQNPVD